MCSKVAQATTKNWIAKIRIDGISSISSSDDSSACSSTAADSSSIFVVTLVDFDIAANGNGIFNG